MLLFRKAHQNGLGFGMTWHDTAWHGSENEEFEHLNGLIHLGLRHAYREKERERESSGNFSRMIYLFGARASSLRFSNIQIVVSTQYRNQTFFWLIWTHRRIFFPPKFILFRTGRAVGQSYTTCASCAKSTNSGGRKTFFEFTSTPDENSMFVNQTLPLALIHIIVL